MCDLAKLRIALVHYWLVQRRGGERVFEVLAEMFPQADLFTLVLDGSRSRLCSNREESPPPSCKRCRAQSATTKNCCPCFRSRWSSLSSMTTI